MRVWIDERSCVGNGVCEELCPDMFVVVEGDVAKVRDGRRLVAANVPADVRPGREDAVLAAAEECPVGCIYVG